MVVCFPVPLVLLGVITTVSVFVTRFPFPSVLVTVLVYLVVNKLLEISDVTVVVSPCVVVDVTIVVDVTPVSVLLTLLLSEIVEVVVDVTNSVVLVVEEVEVEEEASVVEVLLAVVVLFVAPARFANCTILSASSIFSLLTASSACLSPGKIPCLYF